MGVDWPGHVGGLLALFLGASLITVLEIIDVILHCAWHRRTDSTAGKRNRNRKSPPNTTGTGNASNHVMFRPVASESLDDDDDIRYPTNHRTSDFNTSNMTSSGRATLPKVKVNSTTFRGSGYKQAETDIWWKCDSIGLCHGYFTARRYAKSGTTTIPPVSLSMCHSRVVYCVEMA